MTFKCRRVIHFASEPTSSQRLWFDSASEDPGRRSTIADSDHINLHERIGVASCGRLNSVSDSAADREDNTADPPDVDLYSTRIRITR